MRELALEKTKLDGRYDILRLLGRGSYAEIYVARDNLAAPDSLHQFVVIKALNVFLQEEPDVDLERTLIENFQNEAAALDRVRHPNIISRLGHGTARDLHNVIFHYIVLEYLPGGDLMQVCRREPLTIDKTLIYLEQVCSGLDHAHKQGVIHRDIKPQNLLLTEDKQTVKIADFGVARFTNVDAPITRVGTNIYAAPEHSPLNMAAEIANGKDVRLTPAADVYSLAKTVYALLAGESPRKFSNAPITSFPPSLAAQNWAENVIQVVEHSTQRDAENRIQTVTDFWREFYQAAKEVEESATRILTRDPSKIWAAGVAGYTTEKAPSRPEFSSMPNVQIPTDNLNKLPERPRVVVEIAGTKTVPKAPVTATEKRPPFAEPVFKGVVPAKVNDNHTMRPPTKEESGEMFSKVDEISRPSWITVFFKRLALRFAVVLLILGGFAGILAGTYNYLKDNGYIPFSASSARREGVINAAVIGNSPVANLRAEPDVTSDDIGDVPNGSRVRILSERGNWYEVQVIQRSAPKKQPNEPDRGWVSKMLIEVE